MNVTLWIEIGEQRSAFALENMENNDVSYIDLTGGYGMIQVPFKIAYLEFENEVLCGEDAIAFGNAVWAGQSPQATCDFIFKYLEKIKKQYHDVHIISIILINSIQFSADFCKEVEACLKYSHTVEVQWMSITEAFVGYGYQKQIEESTFLYFNDSKSILLEFCQQDIVDEMVRPLQYADISLSAIDQYYVNVLKEVHERLYETMVDMPSIRRIYNEQKPLIYRQCQLSKDIHLYTSIHYPPQKITLEYSAFNDFFQEWIKDNQNKLVQYKHDFWVSGGYNQENYWQHIFPQGSYHYNEHMLIEGAIAYRNYQKKYHKALCTQTKTHWGYAILDEQGRRIPFIVPGEAYQDKYVIELMVTNYQLNVPFIFLDQDLNETHQFDLYVQAKNAITYITMTLKIRVDGQIEEVKYEERTR